MDSLYAVFFGLGLVAGFVIYHYFSRLIKKETTLEESIDFLRKNGFNVYAKAYKETEGKE